MKKILFKKPDQYAIVDDDDYEMLSKYKWHNNRGYPYTEALIDGQKKKLGMHRMVMGVKNGDKVQVDHINHTPHDNRKSNLRICTHAENVRNRKVIKSKTGYKGVWKHGKKFAAEVVHNGKRMYLGCYTTPEEAAKAYNRVAKEYHGEFAYLNKI